MRFWLILLFGLTLGLWFVINPGYVRIDWFGYALQTSVGVIAFTLVALSFLTLMLWRIYKVVAKQTLRAYCRILGRLGYATEPYMRMIQMLDQGQLLPPPPPANDQNQLLLGSEQGLSDPAQLKKLQIQCELWAHDPDKQWWGLWGLVQIGLQHKDYTAVQIHADKLLKAFPRSPSILKLQVELCNTLGNYERGLTLVPLLRRYGGCTKSQEQHLKSTFWLKLSEMNTASDPQKALKQAYNAHKIEPALAGVQVAKLLLALDKQSMCQRFIERQWSIAPHETLGDIYLRLHAGKDKIACYKMVERLCNEAPDAPVSKKLRVRAAIEAELWGEARHLLQQYLESHPDAQGFAWMALLEEREFQRLDHAHLWLQKALAITSHS